MNNTITIRNIEPQEIKINGGGEVLGITAVYVNGEDVTVGSVAYVIVPTKTSELQNDSGFITREVDPTVPYYVKQISVSDINKWNEKQEALVSGVNIKTINDNSILGSGNINISTSYTAGTGINISDENVISNTITSYNDLTDQPTIPTLTSELTNDSGYVTSDDLSNVAFSGSYLDLNETPEIPAYTSELVNDSGYITNSVNDLENYYNKSFMWNMLPKSTGTGTAINLSDTVKDAPMNLILNSTTLTQDGTPTPTSPQDIHTISGSNTIKVIGNQLVDFSNPTSTTGATSSFTNDTLTITGNNATYTNASWDITSIIQNNASKVFKIGFNNINVSGGDGGIVQLVIKNNGTTSYRTLVNRSGSIIDTYTIPNDTSGITEVKFNIYANATGTAQAGTIVITKPLAYFDNANTYTPYISQEADIDLGDLEYCKIGTYADRIFKNVSGDPDYSNEREEGAWYIKKNIGKVVLDGSADESYTMSTINGINNFYYPLGNVFKIQNDLTSYICNYFTAYGQTSQSSVYNYDGGMTFDTTSPYNIRFKTNDIASANDFKTWLSTHNTEVYYVLATPTYTQITGTLAEQLESIYYNQTAYNEQTNISQTNSDLPFTIDAETLKSLINV